MAATVQRTIEMILHLSSLKVESAEDFFASKTEPEIFRYRTEIEKEIQSGIPETVCVYCKQAVAIRGYKRDDGSTNDYFTHPRREMSLDEKIENAESFFGTS